MSFNHPLQKLWMCANVKFNFNIIQIISFLASMSFSHSYKKKHNDKSKRGPTSLIVCPTTGCHILVFEM